MKIGNLDYLFHLYYGPTLHDTDLSYQIMQYDRGFSGNPYDAGADRTYSMDALPQELPCQGTGDYRSPAVIVKNAENRLGTVIRKNMTHSPAPSICAAS